MNLTFFRILLICCVAINAHQAVANDSTTFRSYFEKRLIELAASDKEVSYLSLFSSVDTDSVDAARFAARLADFFRKNDAKVLASKTSKAKVKFLFKGVHDHFLRQYEEVAHFSSIFNGGVYNCVTASMLYAIVFDHYQIDYEIKEAPTHVFLVALPGSDNILVETTTPKGFFQPDEKKKKSYVDGLIATKFTTQEYVNSVGYVKAFNEFYFSDTNISKRQLGALQYYNDAIQLVSKGEMAKAISNITKCNKLYPAPKHEFLKLTVIGSLLDNSDYSSISDIYYLCDYANLSRDLKAKKIVISDFGNIIKEHLFSKDDPEYPTQALEIFRKNLLDTAALKEIEFSYHFSMVSWHGMKSDFDRCLESARYAAAINSKDVRLRDLIMLAIYKKAEKQQNPKLVITELESHLQDFSFLSSDKEYKGIIISYYGAVAYAAFDEGRQAEGYVYLTRLQKELETGLDNYHADQQKLGMPFAEAGAHHYRKREYTKAREMLLKGLSYFPNHNELKERLKIVEEEMRR